MPIKKWLIQYSIALPLLFTLFATLQYVRGRSLAYSIEFGLMWAVISIAVFAARRIYNYKMQIHCAICDDLPSKQEAEKQ